MFVCELCPVGGIFGMFVCELSCGWGLRDIRITGATEVAVRLSRAWREAVTCVSCTSFSSMVFIAVYRAVVTQVPRRPFWHAGVPQVQVAFYAQCGGENSPRPERADARKFLSAAG